MKIRFGICSTAIIKYIHILIDKHLYVDTFAEWRETKVLILIFTDPKYIVKLSAFARNLILLGFYSLKIWLVTRGLTGV